MFKLDLIIHGALTNEDRLWNKVEFLFLSLRHYITMTEIPKYCPKSNVQRFHSICAWKWGFKSSLSVRFGITTKAVSRSIKIMLNGKRYQGFSEQKYLIIFGQYQSKWVILIEWWYKTKSIHTFQVISLEQLQPAWG